MSSVYISKNANQDVMEYLGRSGIELQLVCGSGRVGAAVDCHPDIYMCKLGAAPKAPVWRGIAERLGETYPGDVLYNAAAVGRYFICSRHTAPELIEAFKTYINSTNAGTDLRHGFTHEIVTVPQGYVKCNLAVIDDSHVITEDEGIYKKISQLPDLKCLKISPKHVMLEGYPHGFIGGCCGRVQNEIIFNGDLNLHPDAAAIAEFIEGCGLKVRTFSGPLKDIGSIIESASE